MEKRAPRSPEMSVSPALNSSAIVAVVGTGAMGAGIAQVAAAAGHVVKLLDNRPEAAKAVAGIRAQFAKLAEKGRMGAEAAAAASERLEPVEQLADLADAALVVEAIVESLEAKQKLYRDLEDSVGAGCIFGTNTSSISVTAIGSALQRPSAWPACTSSTRRR
jgi:3-hydroxybutyryl-CoA dehydrogenase